MPAPNQPTTKNGAPNPDSTANNAGPSNVPPLAPEARTADVSTGQATLSDYNAALRVTNEPDNVNVKEGRKAPPDGDTVYVTAVFGPMVDPTTSTVIEMGRPAKVKFGPWHRLQWEAGKLTSAD